MFVLLGISILLVALLTFNSLASLCTAALWRLAEPCARHWPAAARAKNLFLLRVLPASLSVVCAFFLLAPAYLKLEPRTTTERVSVKLAIIAAASAVGISLAIIRGFAAWVATARLSEDWMAFSEPVTIPGVDIPAYRIDHQFPVIAIVGILRPRLFISGRVFDSLTAEEVAAAVEHEMGHLLGRDNLKRGLLRLCRDVLLIIPCGRALDSAWAEASESAADEHAARRGRTIALDLASALVKVSRMIPPGSSPAMPAGAFLIGDEEPCGVKARVRRLIQIASGEGQTQSQEPLITRLALWISLIFLFSLVAITISNPHVFTATHALIEHVVAFLD